MPRLYAVGADLSESFAGWADYNAFTAARADLSALFNSYYGPATATVNADFDTGEGFNGAPSLFFTYRTTSLFNCGWYTEAASPSTTLYVRARGRLATTFVPTVGTELDGIDLHLFYVDYVGPGYNNVRFSIFDGTLYLIYTDPVSGDEQPPVTLGAATPWYSAMQYVIAAEVIGGTQVKFQIFTGAVDAELDALTLFAEHTLTYPDPVELRRAENYVAFNGSMEGSVDDSFTLWIYSIEYGTFADVDAVGQTQVGELLKVRASYEPPLFTPTYLTNFNSFASIGAFQASPPWAFTTLSLDGVFDTATAYAPGIKALRYTIRNSPSRWAQHFSPNFTGDLAGTTNWAARQLFETSATFAPALTIDAPLDGISVSRMTLRGTGSVDDLSAIVINGTDVRHVWKANNGAYTTNTVIDAAADWVGAPKQFIHWVERVGTTSVRVRIWFGDAAPTYKTLTLLYDEVQTSSAADPVVYNLAAWTSLENTEYPSSDAWQVWLYEEQHGPMNYLLDPFTVFEEAVSDPASVGGTLSTVASRTATLAEGVAMTEAMTRSFTAIAAVAERVQLLPQWQVMWQAGVVLADTVRWQEQLPSALSGRMTDAVTLTDPPEALRAVRVLEALAVASQPGAQARYVLQAQEQIRATARLSRADGAATLDGMQLTSALAERAYWHGAVTETTIVADAAAQQLVVRLDAADTVQLTPQMALQALLGVQVQDGVQVSAGLVLPNGDVITWVVNARTGATTVYENFSFNSFARRGTRYLAAADDGLYVLDGATDAGSAIVAQLTSGFLQFAGTRFASFKAVYLGMHGSGAVLFRLVTGDGKQYTYRVVGQDMENTKVRVGKGLRARYFAFELETVGQDFDLDSVEFLPVGAQRRV